MQAQKLDTQDTVAFVGRQPIFDVKQGVYAYELLFRSSEVNSAGQLDDNSASAQVIYNALLEIGLDDLIGNNFAFINFPRELLINGIADVLPPERVVIEILEDVEIDDELVEGVRSLVKQGFKIALDDFVYGPEWDPLLELASIVKLDVFEQSIEEIGKIVKILQANDVTLLAEKVETREEYEAFKKMGFNYFQGYFFAKPEVIKKDKLPDNQIALLQLMSRLQDPDIEIKEVETLVTQTVSLSYKLFRYINSAFFGLPRKFDSVQQAVVYFGLKKLKDLACLIAMTGMSNQSSELVLNGLTRAKMCELLAERSRSKDKDSFFVVGLFSILEALLSHPIEEVVNRLPLSEDVINALLNQDGLLGEALQCSMACEACRWLDIHFMDLDNEIIYRAYIEAMGWARQVADGLNSNE